MYLVTIGVAPAVNLRKSVERAGYKVKHLVLEPLASALAVLTEDEKELGVALVELGAASTDVAIFHEGKIRHLGTIGFGGQHVTSDIVHGLGVTQADAERLKERYGCAYEPLVDPADVIRLPSTVAQGTVRSRASCWRTSSTSAWTRSSIWCRHRFRRLVIPAN
jgi:cell division protein FtsA